MFEIVRCRTLFLALFGAICMLRHTSSVSADDASEGVDFVLMVDVSRSMVQVNDRESLLSNARNGSDPDRIRWDAAKLLLDLLGPGDRLMVCRFNHGCPPILGKSGESSDNKEIVQYFESNYKDLLDAWRTDFKKEFQPLPKERDTLSADINKFNRTDDGQDKTGVSYQDAGGTRIVGALETVASRLKAAAKAYPNESPRRPMHVIVLTDGLDEDYTKKNYADSSELRKALQFYTGAPEAALRPGVTIPIHCIGLNLAGEGEAKARQARNLLGDISYMTGGTFQEIQDSSGLMTFFLCLSKNLRRYWIEEIKSPEKHQHHTLITNGLAELGILSFRETKSPRPKNAIEKTSGALKFNWPELDKRLEPDTVRMGKGETLYRYYYFGRSVDAAGRLESSPFSKFTKGVSLDIEIPDEPDQRLFLMKGTVEPLFELLSPEATSHYRRYQKLLIQVAMLSTVHFRPENFDLVAIVRPLTVSTLDGTETSGIRRPVSCVALTSAPYVQGDDEIRSIQLKPVTSANGSVVFSGDLLLSSLPKTADLADDYEITITARGKMGPHALSNMQQDLPPRIFKVENSLQLEPVNAIELATDPGGELQEFEIKAVTGKGSKPLVYGDIPLKLEFQLPRVKKSNAELGAKFITINANPGQLSQLILKEGHSKIRVSLDEIPERGVQYLPGEIIVTALNGIQMPPLRIPVSLRLDLAKVELKPVPTEIIAKPELVVSDPIAVVPKNTVKASNKNLTVTLKFLGPVDKSKPDPSVFSESELWLERSGGRNDSDQPRKIQFKAGSAETFRVHLHPTGVKTPMKYRCQLEIDGDWIDPVSYSFELNKDAASIEVDPVSVSVPIGRGLSRQVSVRASLKGGLRGEHIDDAHVADIQSGEFVFFAREGTQEKGDHFQVICRDRTLPLKLTETATDLSFDISVPDDAPYGRYSRDFTIAGSNVTSRTVQIQVVVNGIEIDVLSDGATPVWQSASTKRVIQLLNTGMKQTLRLRTGLGEPLEKDEVELRVVGLFQSKTGDVVRAPVTRSELRFEKDRKSAQLDIEFPMTSNLNDLGLPYVLNLVANATRGIGASRTSEKWFVKDSTMEFEVRYLNPKQIVVIEVLPPEAK